MKIVVLGIVLLLIAHLQASGLVDTMRSLREKAWESEYIPESDDSILPLTAYDEFEVVELFRAETIEELEASLPQTYPMPWLEETLKDTSIPWEDRYWLDRRVRAAISQNLHVFYDTEGNPVHVNADGIFPGEFYWREHMIADPEGWNVPEGTRRPTELDSWDVGHLYNAYGNRVGKIALPVPNHVSLSRDASIGVICSGGNGIYHPFNQPYACLMYPDGSFREVPLDSIGAYHGVVSQNGEIIAFLCHDRINLPSEERATNIAPVYLFDREGNPQGTITTPAPLYGVDLPAISSDGHYVCYTARLSGVCLLDCIERSSEILPIPEQYDRYASEFRFSPDNRYLCIAGSTIGRMIDLHSGDMKLFAETSPEEDDRHTRTYVFCSNDGVCTTLATERMEETPGDSLRRDYDFYAYIGDRQIWSETMSIYGKTYGAQIDVSPNGHYLLVNPPKAAHGSPSDFCGSSDTYNLPFIAFEVIGR